MEGFHLQEGLYFKRHDNGDVEIIVKKDGMADSETFRTFRCDASGFASVVSSMSKRDESGETYREALDFLEKE